MAKPTPIELSVIRSVQLTPHMQRITLGGEALATFPEDQESAYIKLIFSDSSSQSRLMRTYTIRNQRPGEIDVDFALHAHTGPASSWAANARQGDRILIAGPGPKKLINHQADWHLLVGDMTALPALAVNLAELPADAKGYAVIEVTSDDDRQALEHPKGIDIHWITNPTPDPDGQFLASEIQRLPWLDGQPSIWAATEFCSMRSLRRFFKQEKNIPRSHLYLSSYWKIGQTEDEHKIAKREDEQSLVA